MNIRINFIFVLGAILLLATGTSCRSKKVKPSKRSSSTPEIRINSGNDDVPSGTISNSNDVTVDYIARYAPVAMDEMREFKIPASITLAQGILESSSGRSDLSRRSNNHFGIKCHRGWEGKKVYHDDDRRGECFRGYADPAISYRDHSLFLTGRERYSGLFRLKPDDFRAWAVGLSRAGYATDRRYAPKLIALIEKYGLDRFDAKVLNREYSPRRTDWNRQHEVKKGDTLYSISKIYGITVDELKALNGLRSNTIHVGQKLKVRN
jgi:flagellum-specific peptidoglycan hydrolase FlgJ